MYACDGIRFTCYVYGKNTSCSFMALGDVFLTLAYLFNVLTLSSCCGCCFTISGRNPSFVLCGTTTASIFVAAAFLLKVVADSLLSRECSAGEA